MHLCTVKLPRILLVGLLSSLWALSAGCGLSCKEYCEKMESCNGGVCHRRHCERLCEKTVTAGRAIAWEDHAQCALDVTCQDLEADACLPDASIGLQWCALTP